MRITEAAECLGISPRMLRYRESLGLLPVVRERRQAAQADAPTPRSGAVARTGSSAPRDDTVSRRSAEPGGLPPGTLSRPTTTPGHRQFGAADLDAVSLGLAIEQRYDISPAALAFGLLVLADPAARAQVAELGRRIGRIRPLPAMALDFEKERAQRLLGGATATTPQRHGR